MFKRNSLNILILILLVKLLCFQQGTGQEIDDVFDEETRNTYQITWYSNKNNSLRHDIVNSVFFCPDNFLWLRTPSGVVRFDGHTFKNYSRKDLGFNNIVQRISADYENGFTLHVKFSDGQVGKIKDESLTIVENSDLYCLKKGMSFYCNESEPQTIENIKKFLNERSIRHGFYSYHQINKNELYIRCEKDVIYFNNGVLESILSRSDNPNSPYNYGYSTSNSFKEFGFKGSFFQVDKDLYLTEIKKGKIKTRHDVLKNLKNKYYPDLQANQVKVFHSPINNNEVYFKVKDSFYCLEQKNNGLVLRDLGISIKLSSVTGITMASDSSNIFISTEIGLFQLNKLLFKNSFSFETNSTQSYRGHIELENGEVLTDVNHLIDENGKHSKFSNEPCLCLERDLKGEVIFGAYNFIARIDKETNAFDTLVKHTHDIFVDESDDMSSPFKRAYKQCLYDDKENLWIVFRPNYDETELQRLIGFYDKELNFKVIDYTFNNIWSIALTPDSLLQINETNQMHIYDVKTDDFRSFDLPEYMEIRSTLYLNDTLSLLATYNDGVWYKNGAKFIKLNVKNSYIDQSNCILDDGIGYIWISTNHGLFRLDKNTLISHFKKPETPIYYKYFDGSDGFVSNEFNGAGFPCANVLRNGEITFPSVAGIVYTDPSEFISESPMSTPISIEAIVDGKRISKDSAQEISPKFRRISFDVQTPHYDHETSRLLYYKLEGYDQHWSLNINNQSITYTRLSPGTYKLKCKRLVDLDKGNPFEEEFTFSIEKHWYQEVWAYAIFALMLVGLFFLLHIIRFQYLLILNKKLEKTIHERTANLEHLNRKLQNSFESIQKSETRFQRLNVMKDKLLGFISHEIVGGVNTMKYLSEIVKDRRKLLDNEDVDIVLNDLYQISDDTSSILTKILNWAKTQNEDFNVRIEKINLSSFIDRIIHKLQIQANEKDITIEKKTMENFFIESDRNIVFLIIHSLLENEVKHNQHTRIEISQVKKDDKDVLMVYNHNNNGKFNIDFANKFLSNGNLADDSSVALDKGLGFWIIKELLDKIKGSVYYEKVNDHSHRVYFNLGVGAA